MPDGVTVVGEKLDFQRPLRTNDSGVYECVVTNSVGMGKAEYMLTIASGECKKYHLFKVSLRIKRRNYPATVCFTCDDE